MGRELLQQPRQSVSANRSAETIIGRLMCGRYTLFRLNQLLARFPWITDHSIGTPRYNIAPTQGIFAIGNNEPTVFQPMRWGLVPSWADDPSIGSRMINARAETLSGKPAFRTALRRRRALIPADGFYEWRREPDGKSKTPMHIRLRSEEPFAFAGLWDDWHAPDGSVLRSCTIITTAPNPLMLDIHDRMPVIVPAHAYERWIGPGEVEPEQLADLLSPYPADHMEAFPVSPQVNRSVNDSPALVEAVMPETLF